MGRAAAGTSGQIMASLKGIRAWLVDIGTIPEANWPDRNAAPKPPDLDESIRDDTVSELLDAYHAGSENGDPSSSSIHDDETVSGSSPDSSLPTSIGPASVSDNGPFTFPASEASSLVASARVARSARPSQPRRNRTVQSTTEGPEESLPPYPGAVAWPTGERGVADALPGNPPAVAGLAWPDTVSAKDLANHWSSAKSALLGKVDTLSLGNLGGKDLRRAREALRKRIRQLYKSFDKDLSGALKRAMKRNPNDHYFDALTISEEYLDRLPRRGSWEHGGDVVQHDLGQVLGAIRQHCLSKVGAHPYTYSPADNVAEQKGKR